MGRVKTEERKLAILRYIYRYQQEHGTAPSVREIGEAMGLNSSSHSHRYLQQLEQAGLITRRPKVARSIRLTEAGRRLVESRPAPPPLLDTGEVVSIPFLGYIVAGEPLPSEPLSGEETVEISRSLLGPLDDDLFALRVRGDSMIDALIGDGDLVLFRKQERVENGEMAAVWVLDRQETTLKRIYWEGDRVRLQPANPTMGPIYERADNVRVQGKVMLVVRQLA